MDVILVKAGYAKSRERAKALVTSGGVYVDGERKDKAGAFFEGDRIKLEVRDDTQRYVSRGGLKLEKAVEKWGMDFHGMVCMDIGASTGGFTDCMLQNGAMKVYSVDVGSGQLDWKLRRDERVVCMERTNFRYMKREDIEEELDFAGADVAFISLTKILIPARNLLRAGGRMVCLIKPQFEAGREKVGKKGVVRDSRIHREVIGKIVDYADYIGFSVLDLDYSPIRGPEGNIEYLLYLEKSREPEEAVRGLSEYDAETASAGLSGDGAGPSRSEEWRRLIAGTVERSKASARTGGEEL